MNHAIISSSLHAIAMANVDKKLRIGFVHPDLGIGSSWLIYTGCCRRIARQGASLESTLRSELTTFVHLGGAERLVVDAAVSLQKRGHEVVFFTSRHDRSRCFEETRDG